MKFDNSKRASNLGALFTFLLAFNAQSLSAFKLWTPVDTKSKMLFFDFVSDYKILSSDQVIFLNASNCYICKQVIKHTNKNFLDSVKVFLKTDDTSIQNYYTRDLGIKHVFLIDRKFYPFIKIFLTSSIQDVVLNFNNTLISIKYNTLDYNNFAKSLNEVNNNKPEITTIVKQKGGILDFSVNGQDMVIKDKTQKFLIKHNIDTFNFLNIMSNSIYDSVILGKFRKDFNFKGILKNAATFNKYGLEYFSTQGITKADSGFYIFSIISFCELYPKDSLVIFGKHCLIKMNVVLKTLDFRLMNLEIPDKKRAMGTSAIFRYCRLIEGGRILIGRYFTNEDSAKLNHLNMKKVPLFLVLNKDNSYKTIDVSKKIILNSFKYNTIFGQMPSTICNGNIFFYNNAMVYNHLKNKPIEIEWLKSMFQAEFNWESLGLIEVEKVVDGYKFYFTNGKSIVCVSTDELFKMKDYSEFEGEKKIKIAKETDAGIYFTDGLGIYRFKVTF